MFIAAVLVCITILPDTRTSLLVSGSWVLVVFIAYTVHTRAGRNLAKPSPAETESARIG
ncbi:hypothetical protein [Streptomyces sp. NPDC057257]|uniref:hypothetical protein n=1 Tax=Streptomyces sp. NPDC057257 TaxID=3346071 RepID=UPI003627C728